jgi:hypothetical protein
MDEEKLNMCIEKLYTYRPAYYTIGSIRQFITGQSSLVKKHFKDKMDETKIIEEVNTNYGTICVKSQIPNYSTSTNSIIYEALENTEHDLDDLQQKHDEDMPTESNSKLVVSTTAIKNNEDVISKVSKYLDELNKLVDNCVVYDTESMNDKTINVIKQIAARKFLAKELYCDYRKYLIYYNRMKEQFIKMSTLGDFARNYCYKGVHLGWNSDFNNILFSQYVDNYLISLDESQNSNKYGQYKLECRRLMSKYKKFTILVTLDDFDYTKDT